MRFNSLTFRLLSASLLVVLLFTLAIGFVLERAFRSSLEAGVTENLQLQIYNLLSVAEFDNGELTLPQYLQDDRLNDPLSGLLAIVSNNQTLSWKSESTRWRFELDRFLQQPVLEAGEYESGQWRIADQDYFYRRFLVLWEGRNQQVIPMQFAILQTQTPFLAQLGEYRRQLWSWLGALAIGLLTTWIIVLKWGLKPLARLAQELVRIENGEQSQLQGQYPEEIEPVTGNLNNVLSAEQAQRQRYQQTLTDLAHSLKTPLAVMRNGDLSMEYQDQIERMDQLIGYQLNRAVVSKNSGFVGKPIALNLTVQRLVSALQRVYPQVSFDLTAIAADTQIRMDEKDLMEVLGNLIENACKYGAGKVQITADKNRVQVADNGPGIPASSHEQILQRGVRLDTLDRGQGIGLAIVMDILASYDYDLQIGQASIGGAAFTIRLH